MKRSPLLLQLAIGLLAAGLLGLLLLRGSWRGPTVTPEPSPGEARRGHPTDLSRDAPSSPAPPSDVSAATALDPAKRRVAAAVKTARVRFRVYSDNDEGEFGVGEALVSWTLFDGEKRQIASGETQADDEGLGSFPIDISPELEGLYLKLHGMKQGWLQENDCDLKVYDIVDLEESLEERLEIYLARGVWLKGKVYGPDGELVENGQVLARLFTDDPDEEEAVYDFCDEGEFALPIYAEGVWDFIAWYDDVGTASVPGLLINFDQDPPPIEVHLRGAGSLSGRVVGASGEGLRGVEVHAVLTSALLAEGRDLDALRTHHLSNSRPETGAFGARRAMRTSKSNGSFTMSGLEPGRYAIACLRHVGDRYARSEVLFAESDGGSIELKIELCQLQVQLEILPAKAPLEYDPGQQTFAFDCTRSDPASGGGPPVLGLARRPVPRLDHQPRSATFLVLPGTTYELHAMHAPWSSPHSMGSGWGSLEGFIPFQGSIALDTKVLSSDRTDDATPDSAGWVGLEARARISIPKGQGQRKVTLTIPAPRAPGTLQLETTGDETERWVTWSLSVYLEAAEILENHRIHQVHLAGKDFPFSLQLQPGRYRMRVHSSVQRGSPRLVDGTDFWEELNVPRTLHNFVPTIGSSLFKDRGVQSWYAFEIREGQTTPLSLDRVVGGTLELGLDLHLEDSEDPIAGNGSYDRAKLWQASRLVRAANGEWRHIDLDPIERPENAPQATSWYRSGNALAPGAWTLRIESPTLGTLEADFVVRTGETTRVQLRADLK